MKPVKKTFRCYIEKHDNLWVAACVDLCLGAQDYDAKVAMQKLHDQIVDHIEYAFENPLYTEALLSRKAPLSLILKYHVIKVKSVIHSFINSQGSEKVFSESYPPKFA